MGKCKSAKVEKQVSGDRCQADSGIRSRVSGVRGTGEMQEAVQRCKRAKVEKWRQKDRGKWDEEGIG